MHTHSCSLFQRTTTSTVLSLMAPVSSWFFHRFVPHMSRLHITQATRRLNIQSPSRTRRTAIQARIKIDPSTDKSHNIPELALKKIKCRRRRREKPTPTSPEVSTGEHSETSGLVPLGAGGLGPERTRDTACRDHGWRTGSR